MGLAAAIGDCDDGLGWDACGKQAVRAACRCVRAVLLGPVCCLGRMVWWLRG